MNWRASLSDGEVREIFEDLCIKFSGDCISEKEFRLSLANLGYNATDIEDHVRENRPAPSEDTDGT